MNNHPMTNDEVFALEDRYLRSPVAVDVPPGDLDINSDTYADVYSNLCDAAVQLLWPEKYDTDPDDPMWHTSDAARRVANVLMAAAGYRPNRDEE
jgi:hypothetical protein